MAVVENSYQIRVSLRRTPSTNLTSMTVIATRTGISSLRPQKISARDASRRVAAMLAPITLRHRTFTSFSDVSEGVRNPSGLI
jgi:hypothetical protein